MISIELSRPSLQAKGPSPIDLLTNGYFLVILTFTQIFDIIVLKTCFISVFSLSVLTICRIKISKNDTIPVPI